MTTTDCLQETGTVRRDRIPHAVHQNGAPVIGDGGGSPYLPETVRGNVRPWRDEEAPAAPRDGFGAPAERSTVGIYLIQDGLFEYVNSEFAGIFGYRADEMIGRLSLENVVHQEDLPVLAESLRERNCGERHSNREIRIRTRRGEIRHVEFYHSRTLYRGRPAVIGSVLDNTDRRETAEELRRLSVAIEQVTDEIVITDPAGIIQYVNPAFERTTGYSRREAVGKTSNFLRSGVHDSDFYNQLWDTIKRGNLWKGQITNRRKDGRFIRQDVTISPLFGADGEITGYISLKRDISESIRLEAQLRQAQKMEAIGTLAGGIAHDFNNILGAIMGYTELAKFRTKDMTIHPYLEQVLKACCRSRDLIRQILTFSRHKEPEKKPIAVAPLVKETMKMLRSSFPSTVEIRLDFSSGDDTILADPTQIHQVVMNLCTNALQAMRDRSGVLEVRLDRCDALPEGRLYDPDWRGGPFLRLTITDNGQGIDPSIRDKIFDPFFTTKTAGEGTGLGLSVVYGIVKNHGGFIAVDSEVGRGTRFMVCLPLVEVETPRREQVPAPMPGGKESILLVDDEEPLALVGKEMLTSLGYDVSVRLGGNDALETFLDAPDRFDLVITDMTMPGLTGAALAREMLKVRPGLPIILTTGSSERISEEEAMKIGVREFMMKPVSFDSLAWTIRRIMDGEAPPEGH